MFIPHQDSEFYAVAYGNHPRTLLGLGGWAGSWELWADPFVYLSESWRAIAYDHRGAGATLCPVESISVEGMVQDVFVMLDAFGVEQCVLAAESAGAAIALKAVLQQPERFQGLVIVDGLYHRAQLTGDDPFVLGLRHHFAATISQFVEGCVPEPNTDAIKRWGRQILSRSSPEAAIRLHECLYGVDLRPDVHRITQPTLIIQGELDPYVSVADATWLADHIPNAKLSIFEKTGHVPTVTRPREVAEAINQYFKAIV